MSGWGFAARPGFTVCESVFRGLGGGSHGRMVIGASLGDGSLTPSPHAVGGGVSESTRITVDEAAALQTYPSGFTFVGGKGSVGLQIGNAVPPLLARAILSSLREVPDVSR